MCIRDRFMSKQINVKTYLNYQDLAGNQLIEDVYKRQTLGSSSVSSSFIIKSLSTPVLFTTLSISSVAVSYTHLFFASVLLSAYE